MKRTIYLLLVFLSCLTSTYAQKSTYELTPGYWTLGLNAGLSYQSSDVSTVLNGYGGGLTLAKNLFYQPNAPIAFDVRGRFLYSQSYGLHGVPSFALENNDALNGTRSLDYLNYPTELGITKPFIFQNYKTDMAELALEGVLTFNQLREYNNIHLALFGGIGLDWYKTRIDQTGRDGQEYYEDYAAIDTKANRSSIRRELESILDGKYETLADDFDKSGKVGLMPAVGLELGYYFTPKFYASLSHKVTFSRTDLLDGEQWAEPNNDIHHYTSLGLNWIIDPYRQQTTSRTPTITMLQPTTASYISREPNTLIRAEIKNVTSAADVVFTLNGRSQSFSYSNGNFSSDVPLQAGRNDVLITASNPSGRAQKQIAIYYETQRPTNPPVVTPPVVTPPNAIPAPQVRITSPAYNTLETEAANFTVRATVQNATKSDIRFLVNGRTQQNFTFNERTGDFSANVSLAEGQNSIELEASNTSGRQRDNVTIIRQRQRVSYPNITITQPSTNRTNSDRQTVTIRARTEYVSTKNDITVTVNGRRTTNFYFDERRQEVEATVTLQEGYNTILLEAYNASGRAQDEVTIRYEPPRPSLPLPVVRITQPTTSITTSNPTEIVRATIQYVQRQDDIEFVVNGQRRYNFNFSNGLLTDNVRLQPGNNTISIRVFNERGQDEARVNIRYQEVVSTPQPPRISFSEPSNNSRTRNPSVNIRATITNISTPSSIRLTVNGQSVSKFSFSNNQFSATADLQEGQNTITLQAKNSDGEDEKRVIVHYDKPQQPKTPPVVRITAPGNNTRTSEPMVELRASVQHVSSKSGIQVLVNEKAVAFTFSGGTVAATVNLQEGTNTIIVKASNADGKQEASVTVSYRKIVVEQPKPTVQIVFPERSGTTVNGPKINLRATVKNVDSKNGIRLTVNGKTQSNFTFDTTNGNLSAVVELNEGNNELVVTGQNSSGDATATVTVTYAAIQKPRIPTSKEAAPTVTITSASQPVINPLYPDVGTSRVVATIENVSEKKHITFTANGKAVTDFSFDASSKKFEATVRLDKGKNLFIIRAKNEVGEASDQTTVSF